MHHVPISTGHESPTVTHTLLSGARLDDANDDMITADADFFRVNLATQFPRFATATIETEPSPHLVDTELQLFDSHALSVVSRAVVDGGSGKIIYGLTQVALDTTLVLWEPINSGPLRQPYVIRFSEDDCQTTESSATYDEQLDTEYVHNGSDAYLYYISPEETLYPIEGVPEATNFTLNPGDSYRIEGWAGATPGPAEGDEDLYNDRDTFEIAVTSEVRHLMLHLNWANSVPDFPFATDLDIVAFYYYPGYSVPIIARAPNGGLR